MENLKQRDRSSSSTPLSKNRRILQWSKNRLFWDFWLGKISNSHISGCSHLQFLNLEILKFPISRAGNVQFFIIFKPDNVEVSNLQTWKFPNFHFPDSRNSNFQFSNLQLLKSPTSRPGYFWISNSSISVPKNLEIFYFQIQKTNSLKFLNITHID